MLIYMGAFIIKKTIAMIVICLIVGVSFLGCNGKTNKANDENTLTKVANNTKDNVEKDISIASGNDSVASSKETNVDLNKFKITNKEDSYSSTMSGLNTQKGYAKFFFRKFSGICTVAKINKDVTVKYESHIEKGKLNVVILDSKDNIIKVLETNTEENIKLNFSDTNEYLVKAVGDEAYKGDIIIEIE